MGLDVDTRSAQKGSVTYRLQNVVDPRGDAGCGHLGLAWLVLQCYIEIVVPKGYKSKVKIS